MCFIAIQKQRSARPIGELNMLPKTP